MNNTKQECHLNKDISISINVEAEQLDSVILKAKELVALLKEANELQSSLSGNSFLKA